MKIISLIFSFFLFLNTSICLQAAKDAFIEFIKTTKNGKVLDLSEQCLGKLFDYHFLLLKKNYKNNNCKELSRNLENIGIDIFINCPKKELMSILNLFIFSYVKIDGEIKAVYHKNQDKSFTLLSPLTQKLDLFLF